MKKTIIRFAPIVLMVASFLFIDPYRLAADTTSGVNRFLYAFAHANIIHLIINIAAYLLMVKHMIRTYGYWIFPFMASAAVVSSFGVIEPTLGFSGVLWALSGSLTARKEYWPTTHINVLIITVVTAFIPHMAWGVHAIGFVYGTLIELVRRSITNEIKE